MMQVNLAQHAPIGSWKPDIGDFVIWHGWVQHWFGVVCKIETDEITVIKKGMPILLFSLTQNEHENNKEVINLAHIRSGSSFWGGKYAAVKSVGSNLIWYV